MDEQNYGNHAHRPTAWLVAWTLAVVALLLLAWGALSQPSLQTIALALLAAAVLVGVTITRTFALKLQNRIIRLEMQVRLARLGLAEAAARLSLPQLIALRFASDGELPALLDRALAEQMTPDQIKRAVTLWQADRLRT